MKKKTSMTTITRNYKKVFRCGYCDLQYIFKYDDPQFYNCGAFGWNCDIYTYGLTAAVTTGYRNMRGERIPDEIINKYTEIAKNILNSREDYAHIKSKLDVNRENFWQALLTL